MAIPGFATDIGTLKYRDRMQGQCGEGHFRQQGELWVSSIGLGTYLGNANDETDELVSQAVSRCVQNGINVIDSAINYRGERGEQSVGRAVADLVNRGIVGRNEILICTKGGFLPQSLGEEWFEERFGGGRVPGIGREDLVADCHCLHPLFLETQLERSLANLGLDTVDVYYLHNPETQLGQVAESVFYERLEKAFAWLEHRANEGKIRAYGLATWNAFRVPAGQAKHISLERVQRIARSVAEVGRDRFRYIQFPFNLQMKEALGKTTQKVEGKTCSAVQAARELGLAPVVSGSIAQGQLPVFTHEQISLFGEGWGTDLQRALQFTRSAPGIATALVGMKLPEHVEENLAVCKRELLDGGQFKSVFKSF